MTIDLSFIGDFFSGDPFEVMQRTIATFWWVPILVVLFKGLQMVWLFKRQSIFGSKIKTVLLAVDVPKENEQLPKAVENVFAHLTGAYGGIDWIEKWWMGKFQPTFSFEICSHGGYVQFYILCQTKYRDLIESGIFSQYPEAEIHEVEDYTKKFEDLTFPDETYDIFGSEFVLSNKSMFPIRTYPEFEEKLAGEFKDPMGVMLESLSKLRPEEELWLQILITPTDATWKKEGEKYLKKLAGIKEKAAPPGLITRAAGAPFNLAKDILEHGAGISLGATPEKKEEKVQKMMDLPPDMKSTAEGVALKLMKPGFKCKIRYCYIAPRSVKNNGRVLSTLKGAMGQFTAQHLNKFGGYLKVTTKEDYFWEKWSVDKKKNNILRYYRGRSGYGAPPYILNTEELATIYHFPILSVKAPTVRKTESRRAEPPAGLPVTRVLPGQEGGGEGKPPSRPSAPPSLPFV